MYLHGENTEAMVKILVFEYSMKKVFFPIINTI